MKFTYCTLGNGTLLKFDHIKWLIRLTNDYIERLLLHLTQILFNWTKNAKIGLTLLEGLGDLYQFFVSQLLQGISKSQGKYIRFIECT